MAEKAFPDIAQKLNAPVRKTAFERQKEEAEAKRKREEAETAAALKEFEDSFADGDNGQGSATGSTNGSYGVGGRGRGLGLRGGVMGGLSRHNFGSGNSRSAGPGPLPPTSMTGRKRGYDGSFAGQQQHDRGMFSYGDRAQAEAREALRQGSDSDEDIQDKEKAAPRQAMQLSDLPVGTTPDEIMALLQEQAPKLRVDRVDILPPPAPNSTARRSLSAIVTMLDGTVSRDVDIAITALQKLYLGLGHKLSVARHSSSNLASITSGSLPQSDALPFGAKVLEVDPQQSQMRYNMAAPPSEHNRSGVYGSHANQNLPSAVYVKVPSDLRQLKLINKTIEGLIKIGPEFEAALMQRPEIRSEEKWSWLFDSTSIGGVYFRWRLWYLTSGRFNEQEEERNEAGTQAPEVFFRDEAPWQAPDRRPRFERVSHVEEFWSDPEYDDDEEEDSDNEENKKPVELNMTGEANEAQYLNPLHRARLTHLLARLPASPANLRRGDVARVSAFAYRHAAHGAEEVASMLVSNVVQPLCLTDANPANHPSGGIDYVEDHSSADENDGSSDYEPPDEVVHSIENNNQSNGDDLTSDVKMEEGQDEKEDTSSAKLIGLYIISDMLHGCDTAGVRNAWKYKGLVEKAFRDQRVFEHLGRIERDMKWGRVKGDRWKSRVMNLLDIWSGWSLYSADVTQSFTETFKNPPLTEEEKAADEKERKEREARRKAQKKKAPIVRQSSEPAKSEESVDRKVVTVSATKEDFRAPEKMDIDDGRKDMDAPMQDIDRLGGDDIFGADGAGDEREKEDDLAAIKARVQASLKIIGSKGSKRPSTREVLK